MALRKSACFPSVGWEGSSTREEREGSECGGQAERRLEGSLLCFSFWFFKCQPLLLIGLHWVAVVSWKGQGRRLAEPRLTEPRPSCHTRLGKAAALGGWAGSSVVFVCLPERDLGVSGQLRGSREQSLTDVENSR